MSENEEKIYEKSLKIHKSPLLLLYPTENLTLISIDNGGNLRECNFEEK
jgi:hypothetical protein